VNENIKLKKINSELLEQIKSLRIELSLKNENLYNSRIIEMQSELEMVKATSGAPNEDAQKFMEQINELSKANARLKQDNNDKQIKLEHQTQTIEKLMREHTKIEHSSGTKHNSSTSSTKERAYS
jgi:hypothetical protein